MRNRNPASPTELMLLIGTFVLALWYVGTQLKNTDEPTVKWSGGGSTGGYGGGGGSGGAD